MTKIESIEELREAVLNNQTKEQQKKQEREDFLTQCAELFFSSIVKTIKEKSSLHGHFYTVLNDFDTFETLTDDEITAVLSKAQTMIKELNYPIYVHPFSVRWRIESGKLASVHYNLAEKE